MHGALRHGQYRRWNPPWAKVAPTPGLICRHTGMPVCWFKQVWTRLFVGLPSGLARALRRAMAGVVWSAEREIWAKARGIPAFPLLGPSWFASGQAPVHLPVPNRLFRIMDAPSFSGSYARRPGSFVGWEPSVCGMRTGPARDFPPICAGVVRRHRPDDAARPRIGSRLEKPWGTGAVTWRRRFWQTGCKQLFRRSRCCFAAMIRRGRR